MLFPSKYKSRINYWNSKGLRVSRPGTKTFQTIIEHLEDCTNGARIYSGKPISMNQFRLSVDRFAETVFNDKLLPVNKKKIRYISLGDFIYSPWMPDPYNCSLLYFIENHPQPIVTINKTALYDHLCQSFVEKDGSGDVDRLTIDQMENISFASKKLTEFVASHKGKIDNTYLNSHKQLTDVFVRHVINQLKDNLTKFNTRALTYNSIWEMLPNFFKQHGYFVATKQPSMKNIEERMNERTRKRPTLKRRRPGMG
jgi:hypothetical protein